MSARNGEEAADASLWSWREVDVGAFKDARLGRRFGDLLHRLSEGMGGSIPFACQDWSNTKAAYRFFSNPRVQEGQILNGHFAATRGRYFESDAPSIRKVGRTNLGRRTCLAFICQCCSGSSIRRSGSSAGLKKAEYPQHSPPHRFSPCRRTRHGAAD
ncbi:IS4/Tn5 family transposase DNA-binding protein [Methylocapsa palsarum]|uniref:IS4/Tn5 family transposase DNA-binding protein n=1 Tax=Methylocapsa palsarum TaxID=1612308 RepID=UPI000A734AC8|nr:transposase DNA-binding-containing protein [Methylocapsa palsarum]